MYKLENFIFYLLCGYALFSTISLAVTNLFLGITIVVGSFYAYKNKFVFNDFTKPYIRAFSAFFLALLIVSVFSEDVFAALKGFWKYIYRIVPFFLVLFFVHDRKKIIILLNLVFISLLLSDFHVIYEGVNGARRAASFNGYILHFASYVLILMPMILIGMYRNKVLKYKVYFCFIFICSLSAVLYNATRVSWLILLLTLPVVTIAYFKNIKKVIPYVLSIFFIITVFIGMNSYFYQRITSLFGPLDLSNYQRVLIWKQGWNDFKNSPIIGNNFGKYSLVANVPSSLNPDKVDDLHPVEFVHAHNNFLQMLAQSGVIGCSGFVFLMGTCIYYPLMDWLRTKNYTSLMILAGTTGLFLQGFTDFSFGFNLVMKMYFFVLGLYVSYNKTEVIN